MNLKANKIWKYVTDKDYRFLIEANKGKHDDMPDEEYICHRFKSRLGYELDLDNPRTFNEKLQWLKLYDRNDLYTTLVDKYAVKDYVGNLIGREHIIPTLGVWNRAEDIDFDSLPQRFVLKCTHDSQGIVICRDKDKLNKDAACKKLGRHLRQDYYKRSREWPYKNVPHRIIAEQYMEDAGSTELRDYKFFCFNGEVKIFNVDFDRFISHRANYYNLEGKQIKVGKVACPPDFEKEIELPKSIPQMIRFAEILSCGIPFVRADFYDIGGTVYFGELTLYPAAGFGKYLYEGNDEMLGSWLNLPNKNRG